MSIKQIEHCSPNSIPADVLNSTQPVLLKGLVRDWPIVQSAKRSDQAAADYIKQFDSGAPLTAYHGSPEMRGRIFYNEDFTEFNFKRTRQTLAEVIDKLFECADDPMPPTYYIGSTMLERWLPGFRDQHDIDLGGHESLASIWVGNKSRIAAHYDFPNNIACSVAGRRKFTLFPPEQIDNLYVGPLDFTPSGQPISLVDFHQPDFEQYPKFEQALASSYSVELEIGDAIFIPSMWWHHVESLDVFNVLVNFWWRTSPEYLGAPMNALQHAVMSLRDLPEAQRDAWQHIFQLYVFNKDEDFFKHIPDHARGILSGVDETTAQNIRQRLVSLLKN